MIELLASLFLFCDSGSVISSKPNCEKMVKCVLKELEGPVNNSQIKVNQDLAVEKCTRAIVCTNGECSK